MSSSEGSGVSCPIARGGDLVHRDAEMRLGAGRGLRAAQKTADERLWCAVAPPGP